MDDSPNRTVDSIRITGFCHRRFAPDAETLESYAHIRARSLQDLGNPAGDPGAGATERPKRRKTPKHPAPPRLPALEEAVFGHARPATVVVTTPNVEYNA